MTTPTISEAARRAAERILTPHSVELPTFTDDDEEHAWRVEQVAKVVQSALDSAHPAPKEGETPETEPEKCEVCGGDEPCSHDFGKIGWPTPSAPSLQSVAEGAAREICATTLLALSNVSYSGHVYHILTRHFAPVYAAREAETRDWIKWHGALQEQLQDAQAQIAERDERIKELEAVDEKRLEVIQRYGEEVCALRTRCEELQRACEPIVQRLEESEKSGRPAVVAINFDKMDALRRAARKEGQQARQKGEGT